MSALARLRAIEISRQARGAGPSKPTKPPFDGFVGAPPPFISKNSQESGAAATHGFPDTCARRHAWIWRVQYPNGAAMDVLFTPEATDGEVRDAYPGASVQAITEAQKRMPTLAEVEELRTLIADVLRDDSEADRVDALAVACGNPDAALLSLRTLRDELRLNEKWIRQRYARRARGEQ